MRILAIIISLTFVSCVSPIVAERKGVPPPGSDQEGSQPWNIPQRGEGAGAMGGILEGR